MEKIIRKTEDLKAGVGYIRKNKPQFWHLPPSGAVGMTLCRRNCHVDPQKIETGFRTFPKSKLINAPHLYLTQIGVG